MAVVDQSVATLAKPQPPAAPAAVAAKPIRLRFVGYRRDYWRLMVRGNALQAVTLGLYRFWLFSDMRRFLWAGIELGDENAEYIGTAGELLAGFLMALGLLIPLNLALVFALLETGTLVQSTVIFAVLFAVRQYAVFRARAYRLTRTVLRGLRFHQTGSGNLYALRAILWWMLVLATVGLAFPFMEASQERYKMRHTYFGDLGARFEGSAWRLLLRGAFLWAMVMAPLAFATERLGRHFDWVLVQNLALSRNLTLAIQALGRIDHLSDEAGPVALALVWSAFFAVILYPAYAAIVLRWWLDGVKFGSASVASDLRIRSFYGIYVRYILQVIGFSLAFAVMGSIAAGIVTQTFSGLIDFSVASAPRDAVLAAIGIVGYVIYILGCSTLYQVTVRMSLWKLAVESIVISDVETLDKVEARPAHCSALGEGLADLLGSGSL